MRKIIVTVTVIALILSVVGTGIVVWIETSRAPDSTWIGNISEMIPVETIEELSESQDTTDSITQ